MTRNMDPGFRSMNRYIVRNNGTHVAYSILPMSNSVHPAYGPISPGLKDAHRVDRYPQPVKSVSGTSMHPKITVLDPKVTIRGPLLGLFWAQKCRETTIGSGILSVAGMSGEY